MADDINDISHTSTYARAEAAIRKDERSKCSPDILVAAATALLEQYDLGTGSCLGVMSDGKACFKGSFLEKLEALRASRAANDDPDDEVFQDVIHALGFPAAAPIQDERSRWSASAAQLNNDIGILLSILHDFEEAVGETIDDTEGVVAQIESDYKAREIEARSLRETALLNAMHEAFMAMCSHRDSPDDEVFQDAIDALGLAAAPCTGCDGHECDGGCQYPSITSTEGKPHD